MILSNSNDEKIILREIYENILSQDIPFPLKPISEFETKWRREGKDGRFILIPNPTIGDPFQAMNNCEYPNVWISFDMQDRQIQMGISFWSVSSVDQRFLNFSSRRNEEQRGVITAILLGLADYWDFTIYKKKRYEADSVVFEARCNQIDGQMLSSIIGKIIEWRELWKQEAAIKGNWVVPAVTFMSGKFPPSEADSKILNIFSVFSQICEMTPSRVIQSEASTKKDEIQGKIDQLKENLVKSKFVDAINERIKILQEDLSKIVD